MRSGDMDGCCPQSSHLTIHLFIGMNVVKSSSRMVLGIETTPKNHTLLTVAIIPSQVILTTYFRPNSKLDTTTGQYRGHSQLIIAHSLICSLNFSNISRLVDVNTGCSNTNHLVIALNEVSMGMIATKAIFVVGNGDGHLKTSIFLFGSFIPLNIILAIAF